MLLFYVLLSITIWATLKLVLPILYEKYLQKRYLLLFGRLGFVGAAITLKLHRKGYLKGPVIRHDHIILRAMNEDRPEIVRLGYQLHSTMNVQYAMQEINAALVNGKVFTYLQQILIFIASSRMYSRKHEINPRYREVMRDKASRLATRMVALGVAK